MTKRYKAPDGSVLAIDESPSGGWSIGWDVPDDGINAWLGEFSEEELKGDDDWEMQVAQAAVKPFSEEDESNYWGRFVFSSKRAAQQALRAANEVLVRGDHKPWPDWAVKARVAGWTPPEGWKP